MFNEYLFGEEGKGGEVSITELRFERASGDVVRGENIRRIESEGK